MVEKKSTTGKPAPKKRAAKKVEEPKPASEVQPTVEQVNKPREINWNVVGLFSALFPLIGTGILFIMGWAYLSNWYSYFGISMSQVNIQPQDVIIQSIPSLVTFLSCFVSSVFIYYLFSLFYGILKRLINKIRQIDLQDNSTQATPKFLLKDWISVFGITGLFLFGLYTFYYSPSIAVKTGNFSLFLYETSYLFYSAAIFQIGILVVFAAGLLFLVCLGVISIIEAFQKRIETKSNRQTAEGKIPPLIVWFFLETSFIISISLALSAAYGINDASTGIRTGGFSIQSVSIVSPRLPEYLNHTCDVEFCTSDQYGLVGENDNAYLLINLEPSADKKSIKYKPGVYIVPRSEELFIIPNKP